MRARSHSCEARRRRSIHQRYPLTPQRRPVVERIAPELAGRAEGIRRRAGDEAALKQLGMRELVGAAGSDVERDVADQPHAA